MSSWINYSFWFEQKKGKEIVEAKSKKDAVNKFINSRNQDRSSGMHGYFRVEAVSKTSKISLYA